MKLKTLDITAYGLAKAVGDYLDSTRATFIIAVLLQETEQATSTLSKSTRIRARTARRWLKKMGFSYADVKKGVYVDGHERDDVKKYRSEVLLKTWKRAFRRFLLFKEDGSWEINSTWSSTRRKTISPYYPR